MSDVSLQTANLPGQTTTTYGAAPFDYELELHTAQGSFRIQVEDLNDPTIPVEINDLRNLLSNLAAELPHAASFEQGSQSLITQPSIRIARDQASFDTLWLEHAGPSVPHRFCPHLS